MSFSSFGGFRKELDDMKAELAQLRVAKVRVGA